MKRRDNSSKEVHVEQYNYLIIGGGMTADAAARGIREIDVSGRIGIISQEEYPPYDRPPLTKGLWFGKPLNSIWRKTEQENVSLHLEKEIVSINPKTHTVTDHVGNTYWYNKLLLATGGEPKRLDCPDEGVLYFRTLSDYYQLRSLYDQGSDFVVIGAGYIGTEIAAALAMNGKKVTMIFNQPGIMEKKLPKNFSKFLNAYYTEKGVLLVPEQTITSVKKEKDKYAVQTSGGDIFYADGVIAGLGITPRTKLATTLNLRVENGIVVDQYLQTSNPDIYSAGDVANFYNPLLERRLRIEHEDAANTMGKAVGRNMAGAQEPYHYLPYFYSDLFEVGYEAIGELRSDMEIVEDWHELYRQGVIYYLKDKKLRGAMLWGIWNQIDTIRQMIDSKETFSADSLVGKIVSH